MRNNQAPATPLSSPAAGIPANLAKQVAAAFPQHANHNPASASTQQTTAKTRLLACAFAFAQDFTHRRAMGLGGFRPKALHLLPVLLQGCILQLQRRGLRLATLHALQGCSASAFYWIPEQLTLRHRSHTTNMVQNNTHVDENTNNYLEHVMVPSFL